ncbi:MAG TPA: RecQ family ATP-dependent DNA helicase, partial [Sandaracinaceae bacterium]
EQERAIEAVLRGRDALVVLPTGYGKSIVYQAPALLLPRPVIAISPLIALMRDQERGLRRVGAPVVRIDSTLGAAARRQALERLRKGGTLVVLTTPETLEAPDVRSALEQARPMLLCVDEAHCISEWGHDFRPAYLRLGAERAALGIETALALTATATPHVASDIVERLGLRDPLVVRAPPHRANLELSVQSTPGNLKYEAAARLLKRLPRPGIVYCATTKAVDEVHAALTRARIPADRYHGKMKAAERTAAQRRFMKPDKRTVMVATSAFGMGIDKPNIRYVVHFQVPGSIEQYVQEAGRAGRDGKPARCVLLFDPADLAIQELLEEQSRPAAGQLARVGRALAAWAGEGKAPTGRELALSAGVPARIAAIVCAQLEQLGLVALSDKRWRVHGAPDRVRAAADDLAVRFEVKRREDARRLAAMAAYAATEECRSVFIRRWFGEEDPPRCGKCDRCKRMRALRRTVTGAVERARRSADAEGGAPKRRRRRRKKRRGGARGGERPQRS